MTHFVGQKTAAFGSAWVEPMDIERVSIWRSLDLIRKRLSKRRATVGV
jgi:hypothetical protein